MKDITGFDWNRAIQKMQKNNTTAPEQNSAELSGSAFNANFLWPHEEGSIEQAGYEFANAKTEKYREQWWKILLELKK